MHIIAAKAVCFEQAMTPEFVEYSRQVLANANTLAATLAEAGCRVVSGGTDTHLMLVDVFAKGVRGKEAETALDRAYITANKNAIPFDVNPPLNPSGMRFGSPAVTTRGFREPEMREVGGSDRARARKCRRTKASWRRSAGRVAVLTERFPLYAWKLTASAAPEALSPLGPRSCTMPFHAVIDVRRWGDFGIGTYIRNLVTALARLDRDESLHADRSSAGQPRQFPSLAANFQLGRLRPADTELAHNVTFPLFLRRFQADLYHIPLNSVAYWMPRPYVVTIHDMSSLLFPVAQRSARHAA